MLTLLKKAQISEGTQLMWAFVGDVEELTGRHGEEAIENWTANLELGPNDDYRASSPGAKFDGNYPGGLATPRTAQLEEANLIIEHASNPDGVDWGELAGLLAGAQASHVKITAEQKRKSDDLSLPLLDQWKDDEEGLYGAGPEGVHARHVRWGGEGPRRKGTECQRRQERGTGRRQRS